MGQTPQTKADVDGSSFDLRGHLLQANMLPALKGNGQVIQGTDNSSFSSRQMPQKKFFQGQSMNYNLSTVRRDPQNELVASKYSAIGDTKKLGSSGGSMYMASSSISANA